ncbi:MAG TPA: pilus assembly protein PilP [Nitrospiraceae bacterium]|nr:pilus assembly protein PilP [Nitrospiraceae bacterium]
MAVICAANGSQSVAAETDRDMTGTPSSPALIAPSAPLHDSGRSPVPDPALSGSGREMPATLLPSEGSNGIPMLPVVPGEYSYNGSGRREPFAAIVKNGRLPGEENQSLPPLQRIGLTELNLIGIIWGGFGYNAMVQTPDGKGYTVRQGTRIGPNNGTVSSITENAVIVHERFTDVYGNKQVREHVKLLHAKEGSE